MGRFSLSSGHSLALSGVFSKRSVRQYFLLFLVLGILLVTHTVVAEGGDDGGDNTTTNTSPPSSSSGGGGGGEDQGGDVSKGHKHLVVFAGPKKTYEYSVEEFFYTYAAGRDEDPEGAALQGWIWPRPAEGDNAAEADFTVEGALKPHQIYQHLVLPLYGEDIQDKLLDLIQVGFDQSTRGIIVGSEEFDLVGQTPFSHGNGIDAVAKIKKRLGLTDHRVTIVLLYKTPRVEQWTAIFNFIYFTTCTYTLEPAGRDSNEKFAECYKQFLCDESVSDRAWETLHTAMNTLHVARAYQSQGWDVVLIDVDGVQDAKLDIEHVIGCEVLGANCDDDGWLIGLKGKTFEKDAEIFSAATNRKFTALSDKQEFDLEHLFRLRDCNHEEDIRSDNAFEILHEKSIFLGCSEVNHNLVTALQDPDFVLDAVRSQKDCSKEQMNLRDVLSGNETVREEKPRNQHYRDEFDDSNRTISLLWLIPLTLVATIGLIYWKRADIAYFIHRERNYGGMPYVIETTRMNHQRPLSALT